ncbi:MAG: hypothetical protein KDA20_04230 [Phycisphaerales bacterium]|nr:hypothetical protein [Phycisphaerales bacterium]
MNRIFKMMSVGAALLTTAAAGVLACGTPTEPPPPPPDPPIVCCQVIRWIDDPATGTECLIVRYFRKDGLPLFQSNPMPLLPTQQCACAVPPLPQAALAAGAIVEELTFGTPRPDCRPLPDNANGYGPFTPLPLSGPIAQQIDSFFDIYWTVAGDPEMVPPDTGLARPWVFSGPGNILPDQVFDIYKKIRVPAGFDPRLLCVPCQRWIIGLFFVENGQVFIEPAQPGAPVPLNQFALNPGASSIYKFTWYPLIVPGPCPLGPMNCPGDTNGDNVVDLQDLNLVLFNFGMVCP